ncbi:MAG: deoxyribodipyrimidine photo-lyase [Bacteroidetes bacterium]|nr:deoxyribodipyrimidine photo-lyase [Fibrella sp.]
MKNRPIINILWFKRDLRLHDHTPLTAAIETGKPLLLLYCFEPSVMADPNYDARHWRFVTECLTDLQHQLAVVVPADRIPDLPSAVPTRDTIWLPFVFEDEHPAVAEPMALGKPCLWVFHREVTDMLAELQRLYRIDTIFSHEETGLKITYDRDKAVAVFCESNGIVWRESQTNGVIRQLKNRDTWPADWQRTMKTPQQHPDLARWQAADLPSDWYAMHRGEPLPPVWSQPNANFQPGGEVNAHRYMHSFVNERVALYSKSISKPLASRRGCSRLSPYLAWGCLSIRQVYQAQMQAKEQLGFRGQFNAFASRLRWHCHFIQKFETEDRMEFENVNRGFDALEKSRNVAHYQAWATGHTGYPMVDACMRCLTATGYINFRMRAMLTSFLAHHLFQHWQEGAWHLARIYTDFEPGIHYAQIQMQAGMTGTNTVRIYNPVKQSQDHDPEGVFIKQWIPELQNCPTAYVHEPWTIPPLEQEMAHFRPGSDYPLPIIDIAVTGREAKLKLYSQRKTDTVKLEKERILKKHAIPRTFNDLKRKQAKAVSKDPGLPAD